MVGVFDGELLDGVAVVEELVGKGAGRRLIVPFVSVSAEATAGMMRVISKSGGMRPDGKSLWVGG